jgi:hypothetical protein
MPGYFDKSYFSDGYFAVGYFLLGYYSSSYEACLQQFEPLNAAVLAAFGKAATVYFDGGGHAAVTGIFENEYVEAASINGTHPVLSCATQDLQDVSVGDEFEFSGVRYTIRVMQPDTGGMTKLISERTS